MQTKLKIGKPNDKYEQEADRIADRVMRMSDPIRRKSRSQASGGEALQAKRAIGEDHSKVASQAQIHAAECPGCALPQSTRDFFEPRFRQDFRNVRVHTCDNAARMATSLDAKAFTLGNHIYFNRGTYDPSSSFGKRLLAHELAHTVQQGRTNDKADGVIQRTVGDGHDLTSERFRDDLTLQSCYDDERLLHIGHRGEAVKRVQETLVAVDFSMPLSTKSSGEMDGIFGSETKSTVKEYQFRAEIKIDGIVGPETIGHMDNLQTCEDDPIIQYSQTDRFTSVEMKNRDLCLRTGPGGKKKDKKCKKDVYADLFRVFGKGCASTAKIFAYSRAEVAQCDHAARIKEAWDAAKKVCVDFCGKKGCSGKFKPKDWMRGFKCTECTAKTKCTPPNPPECPYINSYWGLWFNPKYSDSPDAKDHPMNCFCGEIPIS